MAHPLGLVWVLAELAGDRLTPASRELLTAARGLAPRVAAFGPAPYIEGAAEEAGRYGAGTVYAVPGVENGLAGAPLGSAMAARAAVDGPDLVLFPTSYDGREAAGTLSALIDRPVLANNAGLDVENGHVVVHTSLFGGSTVVRTAFSGPRPWLASFRPRSFAAVEASDTSGRASPDVVAVAVPLNRARVVARHAEEHHGLSLDAAQVVVAGGRGLGSREGYADVEALAQLLDGAPAASRGAVDGGWAPHAWQVGQTGKTVAPTLYLAFGISGAPQHVVGMAGARHVVAVNTDAGAPIFGYAEVGVVGDAREVLGRLIQALRARRS